VSQFILERFIGLDPQSIEVFLSIQ